MTKRNLLPGFKQLWDMSYINVSQTFPLLMSCFIHVSTSASCILWLKPSLIKSSGLSPALRLLFPPPAPWRRCWFIKAHRAERRHARWMQLDLLDTPVRIRPTAEKASERDIYLYIYWSIITPLCPMETGCFTAAQRVSCHNMNGDLFKPERGPQQSSAPAKSNRNKTDQTKPELAQVVTDSKTGRSYSKGKLLGKVRRSNLLIHVYRLIRHIWGESHVEDQVCVWLKLSMIRIHHQPCFRCVTDARIGNDLVVDVTNLPHAVPVNVESGVRCDQLLCAHDWQTPHRSL